jgi:RNA polymerase sigma-70 factor (ECF subfamily)
VVTGYINSGGIGQNVNEAAELFTVHGEFLLQLFQKKLPEQDAYDLWQDLFLSLVTNPIPRHIPNIRNYLYRAALNDIVDFKRRSQLHKEKIGEYSYMLKSDQFDGNPAKRLIEGESLSEIFRQIEQSLPSTVGQVILDKHKNNMSHRQIAEKLNLKQETVEQYMSVGIKKIREIQGQIIGDKYGQS